jgi:hypothetical protein
MNATRRLFGSLGALGVAMALVGPAACTESEEEATKYDPGGADGSPDGTAVTTGDAAPTRALCETLGGYAGVQKMSRDMIAKLSQDCRIGPYFTTLSPDRQVHHADCFETFLAASALCTTSSGTKISYVDSKDSRGVACKTIPQGHQALGLSKDDYSAFQQDVVAAMTDDQVPQDARNAVLGIMNGQPGVYNANKKGNPECYGNAACQTCVAVPDAGNDADTGIEAAVVADAGGG